MDFLGVDDVLDIHAGILETEECISGMLNQGALQSATERARNGPFPIGQTDILTRAALLLRGIAQDHPFVDGNKRTAFQATYVFLGRNGRTFIAGDIDVDRFMVDVATGRHSVTSIREWLVLHTKDNTEAD